MTRGQIECDNRAAVLGTDEFNAKILDEGYVISKSDGLAWWASIRSLFVGFDALPICPGEPGAENSGRPPNLQIIRHVLIDGGIILMRQWLRPSGR